MASQKVYAKPGNDITILVRAVQQTSNGPVASDFASLTYTVPTSGPGGNFGSSNSSTDLLLTGGSIYAGTGFSTNIGQLNVATGTTAGTGIVLNKTGFAGFNAGVKEFYIDASTGKAYFAGSVTAGKVKIGPGVGAAGETGIYINSNNYWYEDGTWSAKGSDIAGALVGTQISKPAAVTNLDGLWVGTAFNVTFNFTPYPLAGSTGTGYSNQYAKDFLISFYTSLADYTAGNVYSQVRAPIGKTASQSYTLQPLFGIKPPTFYAVTVVVEDSFGNLSPITPKAPLTNGTYVNNFPAPDQYPTSPSTVFNIAAGQQGYSVTYRDLDKIAYPAYNGIIVQEATSLTSTYTTVYSGKTDLSTNNINPNSIATVTTTNTNARYIRTAYIDFFGLPGAYSSSVQRTPISPVTLNVNAANEVLAMSGTFSSGGTGNDIFVSGFVYNVTGLTAVGGVGGNNIMTYTAPSAHNFKTGDQVQITGMSDVNYNISGIITVPSGSTTTFTLTGNGTGTATALQQTAIVSTLTSNTNIITLSTSNTNITVGMSVVGAQIPVGTYVQSITNSTTVVVNNLLTLSGITATFTAGIAQYSGISYIANLTYTANGVSKNGYFYLDLDGTGNTYQSFLIPASDLYSQFAAYYPTFTGNFISVNSSGIRSIGFAISQFSRTVSPTLSTAPSPSISANVDGVVVSFDFSTTSATYAEVYRQYRPWTTLETSSVFPDLMSATYSSGGAIGSNTVVLDSFKDESGNVINPTNYIGYPITGTSVPNNTWIQAVSGAGPYTITLGTAVIASATSSGTTITYQAPNSLNNGDKVSIIGITSASNLSGTAGSQFNVTSGTVSNATATSFQIVVGVAITDTVSTSGGFVCPNFATAQVAGNTYKMSALVYQGTGPANIFSTYYVPQYFVVKYYDSYGNSTPASATGTVSYTPINPITNLISSAIQVGSGGSIYVGASASSGSRVLIGANSLLSGVFAFDPLNTNPTTSIIASGTSGGYTFATTNAHIADWNIKPGAIENDINAVATNQYTGLSGSAVAGSPTNGYSFWAGSSSSGNSTKDANFSVTPSGTVLAKNISIIGSPALTGVTALGAGGSVVYTTPTPHNLVVGQYVSVSGMVLGTGATGIFNVTSALITGVPSTTTFSLSLSGLGTATAGTVTPILITAGGVFSVTSMGAITATSANITGTINAQTGSISGNMSLGGSLYSKTIKTATISAVTPNGATGALYAATGHTFVAGDVVVISGIAPYQYSGVFTVSSVVPAVSFTVLSNINTVAVTTPTGQAISSGVQSFILNNSGIVFNSPTTQGITTIDGNTGLFTTKSANIGGWQINPSTNIGALYSTSGTGTIILDSANTKMYVTNTLGGVNYSAGIALPTVSQNDVVLWAGSGGATSANPFYVTAGGALFASNATISGNITASNITATAVLTGNTIQTGFNVGPTVAGVIFDSTGIKAYDGVNATPTINISSSGKGTFNGTITAGSIIDSGNLTVRGNIVGGNIYASSLRSYSLEYTTPDSSTVVGSGYSASLSRGSLLFQSTGEGVTSAISASDSAGLHFYAPGNTTSSMSLYGSTATLNDGVFNTNVMHYPLWINSQDPTLTAGAQSSRRVRNTTFSTSAVTAGSATDADWGHIWFQYTP